MQQPILGEVEILQKTNVIEKNLYPLKEIAWQYTMESLGSLG